MKKIIAGFLMIRVALGGYIDPNTGGMLFQALAGAFAIVSGAVLVFAGRIKMWFATRRRNGAEVVDETVETIEETEPTL